MSDDRYLEDRSIDDNYHEGGIINPMTILAGTAIAASAIMFKRGAFKPIIKKTAESIAERKPTISVAFNDLKKWLESDGYDSVQKSIFRASAKDTVKTFAKFDLENAREIIEHTRSDLGNYLERMNKTLDRLMIGDKTNIIQNTAHNTGALRNIKRANKAADMYSDEMSVAKETLRSKMYENLINKNILTEEKAKKQLDRFGYRKVTFDDLLSSRYDDYGNIRFTTKTRFLFSKTDEGSKTALKQYEDMLNSFKRTDAGDIVTRDGKKLRMHEVFKNHGKMIVDDNLYIDEAGKIIDLRGKVTSYQESIRNLATEWQIPVININPLQLFGADKIGKHSIPYASISEKSVAPFLTGVRGNSREHTIKNLKHRIDKLKDVEEGVTIIDGDVYKIAGDKKGIVKIDYKSKKKVTEIPEYLDRGVTALNYLEDAQREMAGVTRTKFTDYTEADGSKFTRQKIAKFFDIGRQERTRIKDSLDGIGEYTSPDAHIERVVAKLSPKPYQDVKTKKTFSGMFDFTDKPKDSFFVTNQSISLKDVVATGFNKQSIKDYAHQWFADFRYNPELVNTKTSLPFFVLRRINKTLSFTGLGLSTDSMAGTGHLFNNLLLKRFLPVYGAYKAWDAINMIGEGNTDNGTKPGNLKQHLAQGYANVDVGIHNFMDAVGVSKNAKHVSKLMPGIDMVGELPGLKMLNLDQTGEERADYWEHGYDPVRKGRYWSLNETPFVGGKIQYWKPNILKASLADAKYSDSLYGSRKERFANILNPRHYDEKNYNSRPYLMTSPAFENVPVVGPILSATVGKIIAPQRKMHTEYWDGDKPKSQAQVNYEEDMKLLQKKMAVQSKPKEENNLNILEYAKQKRIEIAEKIKYNSQRDLGYIANFKTLNQEAKEKNQITYERDRKTLAEIFNFWNHKSKDLAITSSNNLNYSDNKFNNDNPKYSDNTPRTNIPNGLAENDTLKQIYRTNSGAMKVVEFTGDEAKYGKDKVNKKGYKLGEIIDVNTDATALDKPIISQDDINAVKMANPENPNSITNTLETQYKDSSEVSGMYGFLAQTVTGKPGADKTVIETSGYHRSFNKEFWDQDLGGLSGDISEIFRRFVQKRRTDQHYYNPIRNDMPDWLPGRTSFTDFQHGDPYSKIAHGEERLPGEGYERLHGMNMNQMLEMKTGSSTIGKTKDEIVNHLLHRDTITDKTAQNIVDTGTKMHEKIENKLMESGIGIDNEVEIKDEKNGIIGYYDIKIHDATSPTKEAIVDIKTVGANKLEKVRQMGAPLDEHKRQVNWYLHHTDKNNKGYIYYVDRDNPDNNYTVGFKYDKDLYDSTMNTLQAARQEIQYKLNTGEISRADLYKPIDKYRVLADVAPYSDEYKEMTKVISNMDLTDEEAEEVRRIRDRVAAQREPKRFYDYRFNNNAVVKEKATMGEQIDTQIFNIKGSENPIKLAGVKITKSQENYEEAMQFIKEHMGKGKKVTILAAEDERARLNNDTMKTTKATVISNGMNINKELIKRGLAEEKEDDFSAAGVRARFSTAEIGFGKAWEKLAHLDTSFNTRLLQVRDAKEDYERTQVYGKDFKSWEHPIRDFVKPTLWRNANRPSVIGIGMGAAVGYMTGRSKYGKLLGSVIGGLTIAGAKMYKNGYELTNGEKWIPEEKRRQRDLDDYIDKLKFVKNRRLFEVYAQKALKEDKFDVKKFLEDNKKMGNARKKKAREIAEVKRDYKRTGKFDTKAFEKAGVKFDWRDKLPAPIRSIVRGGEESTKIKDAFKNLLDVGNDNSKKSTSRFNLLAGDKLKYKIDDLVAGKPIENPTPKQTRKKAFKKRAKESVSEIKDAISDSFESKQKALEDTVKTAYKKNSESTTIMNIPENAMKAIEFYNASESTMYGYDPGEPITNIMAAMPKRDKDYFRKFLEAPKNERQEILDIAPKYMKRALQSAYGMKVDPKEDLNKYFQEHYLPGEKWDGWQESVDLESMKVKMIQTMGDDLASYNKWEDDKVKADMYGQIDLPNMNYRTNSQNSVRAKLEDILTNAGYKDLQFSFSFSKSKSSIDLDVYEDRKEKYESKLKERLGMY